MMVIVNTTNVGGITTEPRGLTFDRKNLWMTDSTGINLIDRSANLIKTIVGANIYGITTDRKYLWVITYLPDPATALIYQLDKTGNLIQTINIIAIDFIPRGITTDGKYLWFTGQANNRVYQIDKFGNLISFFATVNTPRGITTDGKYLWVVEFDFLVSSSIRQYDKAGNLIQTINITAVDVLPFGITTDGKYLWWIGDANNNLYQMTKN